MLYGKGVFTTIAIRDGKPLLWDKHWRRLCRDIDAIGLNLPAFSEKNASDQLDISIEGNAVDNGRARLTIIDEASSPIWQKNTEQKIRIGVITGDLREAPENFRVAESPYSVNSCSPLAGIKSCNYLENLMAIDEAKKRGYEEAVRLNERGEVSSGCMANVFWLKDDELFTPGLKTGCLPGTTREYVLENLDCHEVEAGLDELRSAEAIFLTSAGLGIVEVAEFESRKPAASRHPILDLWPPALER